MLDCTDTINHYTMSGPPPPPPLSLCKPFDLLLIIDIVSLSIGLYCHMRCWVIHEIDNHIVDLHP